MSRLAAYYQEDFPAQRKAYLLYENLPARARDPAMTLEHWPDPDYSAHAYEYPAFECREPYDDAPYWRPQSRHRSRHEQSDPWCHPDIRYQTPDPYGRGGRTEDSFRPPASHRSDAAVQWVHPRAPSPLDSGLSSITSSPSLVEPDPSRCCCRCPHRFHRLLSPTRALDDSGRRSSASRRRTDRRHPDAGSVRYGMLGLLGEPVQHPTTTTVMPPKKSRRPPSSCRRRQSDEPAPRAAESYPHAGNYSRPCVVITEASEKGTSPSEGPSSPDRSPSEKSPEPESSVSLAVSNSNSTSSVSSNQSGGGVAEQNIGVASDSGVERRRTMERGILELEDMYRRCDLGDRDLLERAERRDLPTLHQTRTEQAPKLTRSKSDTLYEMTTYRNPYEPRSRAPPLRRSGVPDRIADDMALRRHRPREAPPPHSVDHAPVSYMLLSPHFTPTVPVDWDMAMPDCPDVEYDDLAYRSHYWGRNGGSIPDPQPPFGIPLRPPPPRRVFTDYLHSRLPEGGLQPLCHPRGNPDVVRDDLAIRTLRKEEPDRTYYDLAQVYRKKRG